MSTARRVARTWLTRLGFAAGRWRAPRARVVLATTHTRVLRGNLGFLAEELRSRGIPTVEVSIRYAPRLGPLGPLLGTLRAGYHLAASRAFVVDDYFFPMYVVRPRPGTTRVQVWHAAGAFKKFGHAVLDKGFGADRDLVRHVRIHSNYSLALVSSASVAPRYAEAFDQPVELFCAELGLPRTDLFGDPERQARALARIRETYHLPPGKRVVLYAPTFRGTSARAARYAGSLDLDLVHRELGDDHVVLLKLHPYVRSGVVLDPAWADRVIDASDDPDVNELMLVSDVLVTDWSSVIYEFSLLGRPIHFLIPDDDGYDAERGAWLDPHEVGPVSRTTTELVARLRDPDQDTSRVEALARASFDVAPGGASARLVDRVLLPALAGQEVSAATLRAQASR